MRVTRKQAELNRQRIIESAIRLFAERGVDGVGVAEVMADAGFTHGGFYNHFPSKDDLVNEACNAKRRSRWRCRRCAKEIGRWTGCVTTTSARACRPRC